jgi:hypothetical protein
MARKFKKVVGGWLGGIKSGSMDFIQQSKASQSVPQSIPRIVNTRYICGTYFSEVFNIVG